MYVHGIDIAAARNRRGMKIGAKAVGILNGVRCGCVPLVCDDCMVKSCYYFLIFYKAIRGQVPICQKIGNLAG